MSGTLPPGWTKEGGYDHLYIGAYLVIVGPQWWAVRRRKVAHGDGVYGQHTSGDAHHEALLALQTLLTTAVAEVGAALAALTPTKST